MSDPAVVADDLVKTYPGGVRALPGVSLAVPAGTVLGLLGPNGAGKSTTVKILTTLARADSGTARVAGHDVAREPDRVRRAIGCVFQKHAVDPEATGRENLALQAHLYGLRGGARAGPGRRAAGPLRAGRRGRPAGPDVLRRHAAQARRRDGAGAPAAGAVPGRADDRAGPGGAGRDVDPRSPG